MARFAKKNSSKKLVNRSTTHFIVDVKSTEITGFRRSTIAMRQRPLSTNEKTNVTSKGYFGFCSSSSENDTNVSHMENLSITI